LKRNRTLGKCGNANKESGTLRVLYLAPCGAQTTTTPRHSPPLRYGEPQKQNLPFPFSKKLGGRKKWKKRKGKILIFVGSL
jgi:hypothetical protein